MSQAPASAVLSRSIRLLLGIIKNCLIIGLGLFLMLGCLRLIQLNHSNLGDESSTIEKYKLDIDQSYLDHNPLQLLTTWGYLVFQGQMDGQLVYYHNAPFLSLSTDQTAEYKPVTLLVYHLYSNASLTGSYITVVTIYNQSVTALNSLTAPQPLSSTSLLIRGQVRQEATTGQWVIVLTSASPGVG